MQFKVKMQLLIGVVGFSIWTFIVFYAPDLNNSEYLKFVQGSVLTVVALALRDIPGQNEPAKPAAPEVQKFTVGGGS